MTYLSRSARLGAVFVAALALCLSAGSARAATEDVSATPGESAQGKPDDWGAPRARPDHWGAHHDGSRNEAPRSRMEAPRGLPVLAQMNPRLLVRPNDLNQGVTGEFTVRITEILKQLSFGTRK